MLFAVVVFPNEYDAVGVVASNRIDPSATSCSYPNTKSESRRYHLVQSREPPRSNWEKCPIRVLKYFESYEAVIAREEDAFVTSNLDTHSKYLTPKRKKGEKKRTKPTTKGQKGSSSDEEKEAVTDVYPCPPAVKSPALGFPLRISGSSHLSEIDMNSSLGETSQKLYGNSQETGSLISSSMEILNNFGEDFNGQESYEAAIAREEDAFFTSNFDTDSKYLTPKSKKGKKKRAKPTTKGQEGSSSDEEKEAVIDVYPCPPAVKSPALRFPLRISGSSHLSEIDLNSSLRETSQKLYGNSQETGSLISSSMEILNNFGGDFNGEAQRSQCSQEINVQERTFADTHHSDTLQMSVPDSSDPNFIHTMLRMNHQLIVEQNGQIKELQRKIYALLAREKPENRDSEVFSKLLIFLPVGSKDFKVFDQKLAASYSLRKHTKQILLGCSGKECKPFTQSCLKRLMKDEVAMNFNLTGKNKAEGKDNTERGKKSAFERTETFKLIREVCFLSFKDTKEQGIRAAVSDWLLQSKHRKRRRESNKIGNLEGTLQA